MSNLIDFFTPIVDYADMHPNFKNMLKQHMSNIRDGFTKWGEGFIDRDNKIVKEFQTSYNSSFWEIYLHSLFKKLDLKPNYKFATPDYCISYNNKEIIVEAVTANNAKDTLPEYKIYYPDDLILDNALSFNTSAILRYSNSIQKNILII